jgi:hypothetical protein
MDRSNTQEECIQGFIQTHGVYYDYSRVQYVNSRTKVEIGCPIHGFFRQRPSNHRQGLGCARCSPPPEHHLPGKEAILYLIEATSSAEKFLKFGYTHQGSVKKRYGLRIKNHYDWRVIHTVKRTSSDVKKAENEIRSRFSALQYIPGIQFAGHTECLKPPALLGVCEFMDDFKDNFSGEYWDLK